MNAHKENFYFRVLYVQYIQDIKDYFIFLTILFFFTFLTITLIFALCFYINKDYILISPLYDLHFLIYSAHNRRREIKYFVKHMQLCPLEYQKF